MTKSVKAWISLSLSIVAITAIPLSVALALKNDVTHNLDGETPTSQERPEIAVSEYPKFLNETSKGPLINVNAKNLLKYELNDLVNNPNVSVNTNLLTLDKLDKQLIHNLKYFPSDQRHWYTYLEHDINAYFLRMYVANERVFSMYGERTKFLRYGPNPIADSYISGQFVFKNITDFPVQLKDAEGVPFKNLSEIPAGESITLDYTSKVNEIQSPIHAKLDKNASGQIYLGWQLDHFQMTVGESDDYVGGGVNPNVFLYNNFAFYDDTSALNIKMKNLTDAIDPYSAASLLSGPDKRFNEGLISRHQVATDVKNLFENTFNVAKQSARFTNRFLKALASENNYSLADIIANNSYEIANLIEAFFPEIGKKSTNNLSFKNLIIDLLRSYRSTNFNESVSTLYEIIYKYKQEIKDLLSSQLSFMTNVNDVMDMIFNEVYSPAEFFERLQNFLPQIEIILTDQNQPQLLKLLNRLLDTQETYLLNFLTDKENVTIIVDILLGFYNSQEYTDPQLKSFINTYKSLFIDLLSSAQRPLDLFVQQLLNNNKKMLLDILSLASINVNQFSAQAKSLFDFFITNNEVFSHVDLALPKIKNLLNEIADLFDELNIAKITMHPLNQNWEQQYTLKHDGTYWYIDNLDVRYRISVNGFNVKHSLINALLDFLPNEYLSKTIERFVTDELKAELSKQAKVEVDKYISQQWYSIFVPPNTSQNIVYGPNWDGKNGIIDTLLTSIVRNLPQKSSLRTLAKEIFFGSDQINLNRNWMIINGNIDVSYSGKKLYVLPLFERGLNGQMYMNYQIINATQKINAKDVANKSHVMVNTVFPFGMITIPAHALSQQLHRSFKRLVNNLVNYTINREYVSQNNIYLRPEKDASNRHRFILDSNKSSENVDPYLYVKDYTATRSDMLLPWNLEATKQKVIRDNWRYKNDAPKLNNIALNTIDRFIELSDPLKQYRHLMTQSLNIYGTNKTTLNAYIEQKVYIGTFLNIWSTYGINLSLHYELRFLDYALILPYPVIANNDPIGMTNRFDVSLMDMSISQEFSM